MNDATMNFSGMADNARQIETLTGGDYAVTGSIMDEVPKTGPRSAAGFVFAAIGIVAMAAGAVLTLKTRRED